MELNEFAKKLFNGHEVRMLGTINEPLFVAKDIGKILEYVNIRETISKFDASEKVVRLADTNGGGREMIYLTEDGLYRLLMICTKPQALPFQKWVFRVIKEIRTKGKYDINEDIKKQIEKELYESNMEKEKLHKQNEKLLEENKKILIDYRPIITYHQCDINDYANTPAVYLFHLSEFDYKFGISGDVCSRKISHSTKFKKYGCEIKVIKIWKCESLHIMKDIELKIKTFARENNILVDKYEQKEIITTNNVDDVVKVIDKYVIYQNSREIKFMEIEKMKLDIERINAENKSKELDFAIMKYNDNKYFNSVRDEISTPKISQITDSDLDLQDNIFHGDTQINILSTSRDNNLNGTMIVAVENKVDNIIENIENKPDELPNIEVNVINIDNIIQKVKDLNDDTSKLLAIRNTAEWIKNNPPGIGERASDYIQKWRNAKVGKMHPGKFNKIVIEFGFKQVRIGGDKSAYTWIKK